MKIVHCSDIHLGCRRLGGNLPDSDFAVALQQAVERAISWKADVFIIAGDLFDTPHISPPTLRQAKEVLQPLQKKQIPILAIEGNRDRIEFQHGRPSWIQHLSEEGVLIHLQPEFSEDGDTLKPFDAKQKAGAFFEIQNVRFVGAGFPGAATERRVDAILSALPKDDMSLVMILHAGSDYFSEEGNGLRSESLQALEDRVLYLALGHGHRSLLCGEDPQRPWAINPGALENVSLEENEWPAPRGWAEVELDPQALPGLKRVSARIVETRRRSILRLDLEVTAFGNKRKDGAEKIKTEAVKAIKAMTLDSSSVVRLYLTGHLNVGRMGLEPGTLGAQVAAAAGVAGVEINLSELQFYCGRLGRESFEPGLDNEEMEKRTLEAAVSQRPPEELEDEVARTAELYAQLRDSVSRGCSAKEILDCLEASSLPAVLAERLKGL